MANLIGYQYLKYRQGDLIRIGDLGQILKQQRISLNSKLKIETMTSVNIQMYKKIPQNHKKLSNIIEK